jgi:hypothetical protein
LLFFFLSLVLGSSLVVSQLSIRRPNADTDTDAKTAEEILSNRRCPCGCGRYLPGSRNSPACFGCSVGKTEISRVLEALAAGRNPADIIVGLNETVLVDVFADYTDVGLAKVWDRAVRAAGELRQRRVVLRTPGHTSAALRAVKLAECARSRGKFSRVQRALIKHRGPWDEDTLVELAQGEGLDANHVRRCLAETDVAAQVAKDREHAGIYGAEELPAILVNRQLIPNTGEAIRKAIRKALEDETI